ncbi:MAG: glycosyltransferase [Candidatus Nanohaloarchaeota archaeon]|nr:glycosyltransferase [Candidatus Nanohaloarchaeota archaeon]
MHDAVLKKILKMLEVEDYSSENHKRLKRVVLISPDFFPRKISEISVTIKDVAEKLVEHNIDTHIIAYDPLKYEASDEINGIKVHYVSTPINAYSPLTWSAVFSVDICRKVADIFHNEGDIDLIHSHDWSTFPAGINLNTALKKPLLVNLYSLEVQRSHGIDNLYTRSVKRLEKQAVHISEKVHTTKQSVKHDLLKYYDVSSDKITYINPLDYNWQVKVISDYKKVYEKYVNEVF